MKRVLFLCTGNSCRSQMADGIINHDFAGQIKAYSAGTTPHGLNKKAVEVMAEIGIDIGDNSSDHISDYEGQEFHWVISLCDDVDKRCPSTFNGLSRNHIPLDDLLRVSAANEEMLATYPRVSDQIREQLGHFLKHSYNKHRGNNEYSHRHQRFRSHGSPCVARSMGLAGIQYSPYQRNQRRPWNRCPPAGV